MGSNVAWLRSVCRPDVLIDIGANDGAYGAFLAEQLGIRTVHAFEPLPKHQQQLTSRGFIVHPVALGDRTGHAEFNVNAYDAASSLLPVTDLCAAEFPQTSQSSVLRVPIHRLDDELPEPPQRSLIKIDAQGYEDKIIEGGRRVIGCASVILIEMSFKLLYEGQALFNAVHTQLDALQFDMSGFVNQFSQQSTGQPLFAHCVYLRREAG